MSDYYKLVGTPNRHTSWTTEVVLERDPDTDEPTLTVDANGSSGELNKEQVDKVKSLGFDVEKISKSDAEEAQEQAAAGGDITGAAPVFGAAEGPNQPSSSEGESEGGTSRRNR